MERLTLASIRADGGTQTRAGLNAATVAEYAEAMRAGVEFPPVVVFYDGTTYWLADGFHRVNAAASAGLPKVGADVRQGSKREAILHSVGANAVHGLRRTNEDKRRAAMTLLNDAEWGSWPSRRIADTCGVSHDFVNRLKGQLSSDDNCKPSPRNHA